MKKCAERAVVARTLNEVRAETEPVSVSDPLAKLDIEAKTVPDSLTRGQFRRFIAIMLRLGSVKGRLRLPAQFRCLRRLSATASSAY